MIFKWVKVVIAVEERMSLRQTEGSNQAVDSLPNRMAVGSKQAIVLCRCNGQHFSPVSNTSNLDRSRRTLGEG